MLEPGRNNSSSLSLVVIFTSPLSRLALRDLLLSVELDEDKTVFGCVGCVGEVLVLVPEEAVPRRRETSFMSKHSIFTDLFDTRRMSLCTI